MNVIKLNEELEAFSEHWSPKIVADFNGHDVMVVKSERRVRLALSS